MNENLSLNERFKKYLEKEFRFIAPSKEAMDYRLEVFANLTDRAHELKIKGMTDENAIYNLCIECLGDFQSTLKDFENRITNLKKATPKIGAAFSLVICALLFMTVTYLVVSFATKAWDKTWLIFVGGVFLGLSVLFIAKIVSSVKTRKVIIIRLLTAIIMVLLFVLTYLFTMVFFDLKYDWMLFLLMVMATLFVDTALAYVYNSKSKVPMLMTTIQVSSVLVYVMLGIQGSLAWNPNWLIPVTAALVNVGILTFTLSRISKRKSITPPSDELAKINEEYYTKWND